MDRFEKIRQLRDEHEAALDEASRLRDDYHREIVKLHRSGMSLREIADELGISHQRVHQIVAPHEDPPARSKRGIVAGAIAGVLLITGGAFLFGRQPVPLPRAVPAPVALPHPVARCSSSHAGHSSAVTSMDLSPACQRRASVVIVDNKTGEILGIRAVRTRDPHKGAR